MRRWLILSAKLYPRAWRERYGPEFDALMQDVEPDARELANVLGGALKMQIRSDTAYLKLAAAMSVLGALAALGVSFRLPDRYVSTAVLKLTPRYGAPESVQRLEAMKQEILSRSSLAEVIQRPSFNLYSGERQRIPMEDVIQQARRDIQIRPVSASGGAAQTFSISFTYPDLVKAQEVALELTTRFMESNLAVNTNRVNAWRAAFHEAPPAGETLEVIASPSDPRKAGGPNRPLIAAAGLLVGFLIASTIRWTKQALRLAAFAAAGCALAGAVSWFVPNRYVSTAEMRITPAIDPKRWYAGRQPESPDERVRRITQQILASANLEDLILRPRLDLYRRRRADTPMTEIVRNMRDRDIRIQMLPAAGFLISFSYPDAITAQAVVRELVTQYTERSVMEERARVETSGPEYQMMAEHKVGENLEVLDPASLPQTPVSPNRLLIAAIGMAAGLLLGVVLICLPPRSPAANLVLGSTPAR